MNIKECIDTVDNLKPNQYTIREKVMWLSFIEEIIINDVLKTHEGYDGRYDDFEGYTEDKISVTLIVPSPYDRLYTAYLEMKIDEANNEIARYNNSATKYNNYMSEYKKYYNKTHMPLNVLGRKNNTKPIPKPSAGLSDAELQNLINELTHNLTEYFSDTISPDKLYDIVMKYVQNNVEMLKGKDGRDGVDGKNGHTPAVGVDYFTENDKMEFLNHLQEYISSIALSEGDVTTEMIDDDAVTTTKLEDNAVTTEKIADGAVTSGKIADKAISSQHLSTEFLWRINSNKFDGRIEVYTGDSDDPNGIDNREYPSGFSIYKLIDDFDLAVNSGILIVYGRCDSYSRELADLYQTQINATTGEVLYRHSLAVEGNRATSWSKWENCYVDSIPVANYPAAGQEGTAGVVKLGRSNGLSIINGLLVIEPAASQAIAQKNHTRLPITTTSAAYAVAEATHQSLADDYNPNAFKVVHSSKSEAANFPTTKDRLPVSYGAVKKAMPYTVDENNNAQFKSGISGGSIYSSFENVGCIYNDSFGANLSRALYLEVYSGEPTVIFNISKYVRVTIAGITITIPSDKFKYYGTNTDNNLYWYKDFINDYPQFADYGEEMPDGDVAVASGTSCYKIDSDGAAEFTSLAVPHMYLTSPDNSIYKVTVNNNGDLETTKVTFDENGNETIVPPDIEFE